MPLIVSSGDTVTVSLTQQAEGVWAITFENHTTGQRYHTMVRYTSSRSSAEWIEGAPSGGRRGTAASIRTLAEGVDEPPTGDARSRPHPHANVTYMGTLAVGVHVYVTGSTRAPLTGAVVGIWHCDTLGVYSGPRPPASIPGGRSSCAVSSPPTTAGPPSSSPSTPAGAKVAPLGSGPPGLPPGEPRQPPATR
ncbi:MAG: hypothetical protein C4290_11710 [Chloroflexota bacterium]